MRTSLLEGVLELLRGPLFKHFRAAVFWNVAGSIASQGAAFLGSLIVARILGREAYGAFAIISSTMLTLAGVAQLATGFTANKFVAEFATADPDKAGRVLGLCQLVAIAAGLVASLALLFGASALAKDVFHVRSLAAQLNITAGFVFFAVISGVVQGGLTGLHAFRLLAIANVVQGVFYVGLCWAGAYMFGLTGAVVAMTLGGALRWAIGQILLVRACRQRGIRVMIRDAWREKAVLYGFAVPAALSGFSSMPALWAGNVILVSQGGNLAGMAYFGAAMTLKTLILFLPAVIDGVGSALINREWGGGDRQAYRQVFNLNLAASGIVAGTATVGAILFARPLMALFGQQFEEGADILRLLALAACLQALMGPFYQLIQSRGRMWFSLFGIALPRDLLLVVLAFALAPRHGALGLGVAQLLAWALALLVVFAATHRARHDAPAMLA